MVCMCVCVLYACIYVQILGKDAEHPAILCLETGSLFEPKARLVASPWDHSVSSPRSTGVTNKPMSSFVHRCWGFELGCCCSHTKCSYHWAIFPTPIFGYSSFFSHWLSECFVRQLIGFPSVIAAVYPLSSLPVFMSPLKFRFSSSRLISLFLDSFWILLPTLQTSSHLPCYKYIYPDFSHNACCFIFLNSFRSLNHLGYILVGGVRWESSFIFFSPKR